MTISLSLPDQSMARNVALAQLDILREYRGSDQSNEMLRMLDAMQANYQARLVDCPDTEIHTLRAAAKQVLLLRIALSADDTNRIALLI